MLKLYKQDLCTDLYRNTVVFLAIDMFLVVTYTPAVYSALTFNIKLTNLH